MKRTLLIILVWLLVGATSAQAAVISRIAAVVNDDIITTHQLDLALQTELSRMNANPTPAQLGALRKELLSRLIEESLVQQRIVALKLTVSENEIEMAIQDVQRQNQLTREDLEEAILAQGMAFEDYRENLRKQILRYKLMSVEVRRKIDVSEGEIRDYYRAHLDEYRIEQEVTLSAVTFPISERAGMAERDAIRKAAQIAGDMLKEGQDLGDVAAKFSSDYGAEASSLGTVAPESLDPEFITAIAGVEPGGFGPLVEKPAAFILLRVDERQDSGLRQYYSVEEEIRQHLIEQKTDVRIKQWTKGLKQRAFIDIRI
ncbi:MAG: SurA N-terminal domain-containing protein [Desulfuromonadales bacterium]|nr:SurA N-terminal domain-containing protein [Desulfuromonadales bacterium]